MIQRMDLPHGAEVFSYLRYSSGKQAHGHSEERQDDVAAAFAERMGVPFNDKLIDRGLSGFTGANLVFGALGSFLKKVEGGTIKRGSLLVVESFDRLSRQEAKRAAFLLLGIVLAGVRIVQLLPSEMIFDEDSDLPTFITVILTLARAHDESATKSARVGKARVKARADAREGVVMKQRHPVWLRRKGDQWEVVADKADVVRRIFRLRAEGHGTPSIAAALNADGVPTFGRGDRWKAPVVYQLLTDGRALGRMQPRGKGRLPEGAPIEGYYPVIIDETTARRAASAARDAKRRPARSGPTCNVFSGLLTSAGAAAIPFVMVKTHSTTGAYHVLAPATGERVGIAYVPFERAIFAALKELHQGDLAAHQDDGELEALQAELSALRVRADALVDDIATSDDPILRASARRVSALIAEKEALVAEEEARRALPPDDALAECQRVLVALDDDSTARAQRVKLRTALRALCVTMQVVIVRRGVVTLAAVQMRFIGGGSRDYLIASRRAITGRGAPRPATLGVWSLNAKEMERGERLDFTTDEVVADLCHYLNGLDLSALPMESL